MSNATSMSVRTALIAACASAALSQKERPRPMTPNPITTAPPWTVSGETVTELTRANIAGLFQEAGFPARYDGKRFGSDDYVNRFLCAADMVLSVHNAELEKLKAERDAAKDDALKDIISKDVVESIQALYGATKMENTRLTSQLDGIMKCISYRKAIYQTKKDAADPLVDDTMTHWESLDDRITAFEYLEAEIASQWIKDRQAKADGEAS